MPMAEQICTPLSADVWDNLSPQASLMDVHNPHEACGYSYNGCTDARRPAYECPFFVHSGTLNFELMWRRKYKKKLILHRCNPTMSDIMLAPFECAEHGRQTHNRQEEGRPQASCTERGEIARDAG